MNVLELQKEHSLFNTEYRERNQNNLSKKVRSTSSVLIVIQGKPAANTEQQYSQLFKNYFLKVKKNSLCIRTLPNVK